jgi:hypothetical protein
MSCVLPAGLFAQVDPCDPVPACPCDQRCDNDGWGIKLTVHPANFDCFKFYRKKCGQSVWVLFYEGEENSVCDCGYDPSNIYAYKVERYWDLVSGECDDFYDDCETLWVTGDCEWTNCSP